MCLLRLQESKPTPENLLACRKALRTTMFASDDSDYKVEHLLLAVM